MEDIEANTTTIENRVLCKLEQKRLFNYNKIVASLLATAMVLLFISIYPKLNINEPSITMTVYAAENDGVVLTNTFIDIKTNASFLNGGYSTDNQGNVWDAKVNYNIILRCEGKDIDSITYSTSDKEITRESNLSGIPAYFIENLEMPIDEFLDTRWGKDDKFLFGGGYTETIAHVSKLVGSSFTVNYNDQMNEKYGLLINCTVDTQDVYHFENFTINMAIKMKDGKVYNKQLLVHETESEYTIPGIEMRLVD